MTGGSARFLEGNGAGLVRERAVADRVQRALERLYQLDRVADVDAFLEEAANGERETLFVREAGDGAIEMALRVPRLGARAFDLAHDADLDPLCQIIEGVSHFVYLAHRARSDRGTTQLELELQAEVDKYVLLAHGAAGFHPARAARVRARLFERVIYLHTADTETGARYRMANDLAARFAHRLEGLFTQHGRFEPMRTALRRFYGAGQAEKIGLARAA